MGRIFLLVLSACAWGFRPPPRLRLIVLHLRTIGVESLSVVILSGVFTGMVMGLQGYYSLRKFYVENFLGSAVALGILRELGPVGVARAAASTQQRKGLVLGGITVGVL